MNVRPGCSNFQQLWVVFNCTRIQQNAQVGVCLPPRVYPPSLLLSDTLPRGASPVTHCRVHGGRCGYAQAWWCVVCCLPVLALLFLLGCASQLESPELIRDDVLIHVHLVDHIDYQPGAEAFGLSRCANGVCVLQVLREHYPFCLLHEFRHAFEGDWHPGRETLDDC